MTYPFPAQRLLRSMSIKQGLKYNSPESKADIPTFVAYHKLNVDEIKEPLDSFSE
jgi:phosphatidylserine decarboxylase